MTEGAVDARIVVEWITGRPSSFRRAVFGAPGAPIERLAAGLRADDVVIAPGSAPVDTAARVVRYDGGFDEVGDVLHVAGHAVELQHYASAAYVELLGPTAMRFLDGEGWRAFLDDADLARDSGVFAGPLTDARLRLADAGVLTAPFEVTPPVAVHVHDDGRVTCGAQGAPLGTIDTPVDDMWAARPRWTAMAGLVAPDDLARDLVSRPWLGRHLRAAELRGVLGLRSGESLIDGFGWSADGLRGGDASPRPDDPFLVRTRDGILLADLRTRRRQRLSEIAATVVAAMQSSSDPSRAAERIARGRGVSVGDAHRLCAEASERLGVRTGAPAAPGSTPATFTPASPASVAPGSVPATAVVGGGT